MAQFSPAFKITMHYEGGFANNKADSGGMTYMGVARNYNPHWAGWPIIDAYIKEHGLSKIDAGLSTDVKLQELVRAFYVTNYWDVNQLGLINDQQIANVVFDTGVNMGTGRAARYLQTAAGTAIDGIIGKDTLAKINNGDAKEIYDKFQSLRKAKYDSIVDNNPTQKQFYASWMSRIKPYLT